MTVSVSREENICAIGGVKIVARKRQRCWRSAARGMATALAEMAAIMPAQKRTLAKWRKLHVISTKLKRNRRRLIVASALSMAYAIFDAINTNDINEEK